MTNSILLTIKQLLGIDKDYNAFDTDIIVNINSAIMSLAQIGIGPESGLVVTNTTTEWDELVSDDRLEAVKTYIYLKVKMVFDPPSSSFVMESMKQILSEYEWRLNAYADK